MVALLSNLYWYFASIHELRSQNDFAFRLRLAEAPTTYSSPSIRGSSIGGELFPMTLPFLIIGARGHQTYPTHIQLNLTNPALARA